MFKIKLRRLSVLLALVVAAGTMMSDQTETQADEGGSPLVTFETTHGSFAVALEPEAAPETVANFVQYVRDGHFDGTIFHRVIAGFMIQGGGYTQRYEQLPMRAPIQNEAPDAPGNDRGTIAMARTADPHSATAQFFINVVDNDFLNHRGKNPQGWGLYRVRPGRRRHGDGGPHRRAADRLRRPLPERRAARGRGHRKGDGRRRLLTPRR